MLNKWILLTLFVIANTLPVSSQAIKVINPLSKVEIALLDFITKDSSHDLILNFLNEDFRLGFTKKLSNGTSFIKRKEKVFIQILGTGRLYEIVRKRQGIYQFTRIDSTLYFGSNFSALNWMYKDTIFQFGGTGFWKVRDYMSYYSAKTHEWEIYNTANTASIYLSDKNSVLYFMDEKLGKLYLSNSVKQQNFPKTLTISDIDSTIVFDFAKRKWENIGALNPRLKELIKKQASQLNPFGPYLIFHSDIELYWLNFSTNSYGAFTPSKQAEFREKYLKLYNNNNNNNNNNLDYAVQFVLGSNYYLIRITKEGVLSFESISLSLTDIKEEDAIAIYTNDRFVQIMKVFEPGQPIIGNALIVFFLILMYNFIRQKRKKKTLPDEVQTILYKNFYSAISIVEKELIQTILQCQIRNEQISIKMINKIIGVQQKDILTQNKSRSDHFLRINQKFKLATRSNELLIIKQREETDKRQFNYNINPQFLKQMEGLILNNQ
jgi:hypothetical protein